MAKKSSLADLDIVDEGMAQLDGLAERLTQLRDKRVEPAPEARGPARAVGRNQYRAGKTLLQVMLDESDHVELSIIAKRRRATMSDIVKEALDEWLSKRQLPLRVNR